MLATFLKSDKYTFNLIAIYTTEKNNIELLELYLSVINSSEIPKQQISASKAEEDLDLRGKL